MYNFSIYIFVKASKSFFIKEQQWRDFFIGSFLCLIRLFLFNIFSDNKKCLFVTRKAINFWNIFNLESQKLDNSSVRIYSFNVEFLNDEIMIWARLESGRSRIQVFHFSLSIYPKHEILLESVLKDQHTTWPTT